MTMLGNSDPLTPDLRIELDALEAMLDDTVDTSDAPPTRDWTGGRRGVFFHRHQRHKHN